ncbi:uncharacterized protein LY89DRAFT_723516 [Mollisia scopiformis]|uniref:Uncharacterized protein n=1 Tax=Mollisia scopiformis TaxID=149040 RepID=A0A132BEY4_MOLSC|nr:uncharacterized protein LY89DRAFT_723516 [Mollisia scopiformis]KUJ10257.1 hypothetical protein LY89DRAFT_723516 [Mollisia scopiformis]
MSFNGNLRAFLRKGIKKSWIKAPDPRPANEEPDELPLFVPIDDDDNANSRLTTVFGSQRQTTTLGSNALSHNHSRISFVTRESPHPTNTQQNPEITRLRKEAEALVTQEVAATTKAEKMAIIKEREALILNIRQLERSDQEAKVNKLKDPYYKPLRSLPEPVSPGEKKKLMKQADLIAKARTTPVKPQKRRREDNSDDDLDGEERFHLGIKKPRKVAKATGHWQSTIHSYMPESLVDTETFNTINNLTPEQRMVDRRDLIGYCKDLAEIDRIDRRMQRRLGWRK